eukprot:COSAG01_NODE_710_length_14110_cov_94.506745_13_plen_349_part_00
MKRSITWDPEIWRGRRAKLARDDKRDVVAPAKRTQAARVARDEFFHHRTGGVATSRLATMLRRVRSGTPQPRRRRQPNLFKIRKSRSMGSDDGLLLSPAAIAARVQLFDVTAAHGDEEDSPAAQVHHTLWAMVRSAVLGGRRGASGEPEATAGVAAWMRVLSPELVPLRPRERKFVIKQRLVMVLAQWVGGIQSVSSTQKLLSLCHGDVEAMANHSATISTLNSFIATFLSPIVCAFSDQFGRIPFMVSGQVGMLLWLLAQTRMASLNQRLVAVVAFLGVMRAGVGVVSQSAFSDLFAFQPEISASIQASDGIWANVGSFTGLSLGMLVRAAAGDAACFYLSAVLAVL